MKEEEANPQPKPKEIDEKKKCLNLFMHIFNLTSFSQKCCVLFCGLECESGVDFVGFSPRCSFFSSSFPSMQLRCLRLALFASSVSKYRFLAYFARLFFLSIILFVHCHCMVYGLATESIVPTHQWHCTEWFFEVLWENICPTLFRVLSKQKKSHSNTSSRRNAD